MYFIIHGFLICLFTFSGMSTSAQDQKTSKPFSSSISNANLTFSIIQSKNKTFGYDIFSDQRLLIHQPSIPAISGNLGFNTKKKAESVARLVIKKIQKGEMPPSVSIEEMKALKAIP